MHAFAIYSSNIVILRSTLYHACWHNNTNLSPSTYNIRLCRFTDSLSYSTRWLLLP